MKNLLLGTITICSLAFNSCSKGGGGFNIFSIEDEKTFGLQMKQEIANNPAQYPVLNPTNHAAAYNYIYGIRDEVLNSGSLTYKNEFAWELYIIKDDNTQNAFCTPGGYIYVYTGLIKYLDDKSSLAGVLGHEMAHADRRHATKQMTKKYSLQVLLDIVLGKNQGMLTEIAAGLAGLDFSRDDETEADKYSVTYLCPTKYQADGAANFFQKMIDAGSSNPPEFLSTHPNPDNRVQKIRSEAQAQGCTTEIDANENINTYSQFKSSL